MATTSDLAPTETTLPPVRTFESLRPWPSWSVGLLIFMIILTIITFLLGVWIAGVVFLVIGLIYPIYHVVSAETASPVYVLTNRRAFKKATAEGPIVAECIYCQHVVAAAANVGTTQIRSLLKPGALSYEHGDVVFFRGTQHPLKFEDVLGPKEVVTQVMAFVQSPHIQASSCAGLAH